MKLKHPNIDSPIFKLIDVYEFDIAFEIPDDIDRFSFRVEIFQSQSENGLYRCRTYRTDMWDIKPNYQINPEKDLIATVTLFAEHHFRYLSEVEDIRAASPENALREILDRLSKSMEHITGKEIEIEEGG